MDNSELNKKINDNAPINREYGLTVKVDVRMIPLEDVNGKGEKVTYNSRMIYLVPQVSTTASMFFDAWLPKLAYKDDGQPMHHELGVRFSHPVYRTLRMGVCRKNKNYPDSHHLVLMSSESAEDILAGFNGQTLTVMVVPDKEAEAAIG